MRRFKGRRAVSDIYKDFFIMSGICTFIKIHKIFLFISKESGLEILGRI